MTEHPITPPPEMVEKWKHAAFAADDPRLAFIWAARWGADQELEACIDAIARHPGFESPELFVELLRAARRPKPPSLVEEALNALVHLCDGASNSMDTVEAAEYIQRALERLQQLEDSND